MRPQFTQLKLSERQEYGNGCGLSARWLRVPQFIFTASCRHHDFNYERGTSYRPISREWLPNAVWYALTFIAWKLKADTDFYRHMIDDAMRSPRPFFFFCCSTVYYIGVLFAPMAWIAFTGGRWRTLDEILARDREQKAKLKNK